MLKFSIEMTVSNVIKCYKPGLESEKSQYETVLKTNNITQSFKRKEQRGRLLP